MKFRTGRGSSVADPTQTSDEEFLKLLLDRVSSMEGQLGELRREISLHIRALEISRDPEIKRLAEEGVRLHGSGEFAKGPSTPREWAEHYQERHRGSGPKAG